MNLVFIYGPPAAGKMTVATELAKLTGYKIVDNHAVIDILSPLFPYEDERLNKIRQPLARKIRLDIFNEATKSGIDVITTFGSARSDAFEFLRQVAEVVEKSGGKVCYVRLVPNKDTVRKRVVHQQRKQTKLHTVEGLDKWFKENPHAYDEFPDRGHLSIDNSNLDSMTVAKQIIEYYSL